MFEEMSEYENLYKFVLPDLIPSDSIFDLATFFRRLNYLFNLAGTQTRGEDFSFSFGFHIHSKKRGREILYYSSADGYNMPGKVKEELKGNRLKEAIEKKFRKYFSESTSPDLNFLDKLGYDSDIEEEIRSILAKNIYNQLLEIGEYPKFITQKETIYNDNYSIQYSEEDLKKAGAVWSLEYFIVTTLESTFFAPQNIDNGTFSNFKTIMLSEPVFMSYTIPIGDIFISFTYDEKSIKNPEFYISSVFKNRSMLKILKSELGSLCRMSYMHQIVLYHALRSAVAAIMARNMSHIHGSHIEPGLQHKMSTFDEDIREKLESYGEYNIDDLREEAQRQLSYYRQGKMDLIARMATEWPQWGCGLDFYTFFIQSLIKNPLLLHFINLSDNIALSQVSIKYGYVENSGSIKWAKPKVSTPDNGTTKTKDIDLVDYGLFLLGRFGDKYQGSVEDLHSPLVRVRDADIGVQAFFSFFEGLIRNAAKHRIRGGNEDPLQVRIVFCEDGKRLKCLFNENGSVDISEIPEDKRFCYLLMGVNQDKLNNDEGKCRMVQKQCLLEFLKARIRSQIIDSTGTLTPGEWGLKEMKICAAFLSAAPLKEVDSREPSYIWITKSPPVVWQDKDNNERLAYIIRLEKPRYLLAIVSPDKKPEDVSSWESKGIKVVRSDEIRNVNYDYDFLYLDNNIDNNIKSLLDAQSAALPQRMIKDSINLESDPMSFFYKVYDKHLQRLMGSEKYKVCIYFEDDDKAKQWQDWWNRNENGPNVCFICPKECEWISKAESIENDTQTRKLLILRHTGIGSLTPYRRSQQNEGWNKVYYQEYCSYSDPFFSFLYNINPQSLGPLILRQIIESAILNVLVIDERIAQVLTTAQISDKSDMVKLEEKLYWMGIYVAKSVKAKDQCFNYIGEEDPKRMLEVNIKNLLCGKTNLEEGFPIHMLLIHATKLNEIANALGKSNIDLIKELKNHIPYVIVHSGRGRTKGDIPTNTPFLEYSIVQRYLLQEPSKFFLTQIALSAKGGI